MYGRQWMVQNGPCSPAWFPVLVWSVVPLVPANPALRSCIGMSRGEIHRGYTRRGPESLAYLTIPRFITRVNSVSYQLCWI